MNGKPLNSVATFPGRTYSSTTVGKIDSVYTLQAGHCGSAYSVSMTLAEGDPSTLPLCGIPLRSATGVAVAAGVDASFRKSRAPATSAAAAATATTEATMTALLEGRLPERWSVAAIRPEVCLRGPFRADGTAWWLRDMRTCAKLGADRDYSRDARDEQRQHLLVRLRLDLACDRDATLRDGDGDAPRRRPERPAQDVVLDLARELVVGARERANDVRSRKDPDELRVLHDRETVDPLLDHEPCRVVDRSVR